MKNKELGFLRVAAISKFVHSCIVCHEGRHYDCPIEEKEGEQYFKFLKQWHKVDDYADESTDRG